MTLSIISELNLFEAICAPPEGMLFSAGLWITHDVDTGFVSNRIAPALLGIEADNECISRQKCRNDFSTRKISFVIVHAADRRTINTNIDQIGYIPIAGRRLHAKYAVLLFEGENKKVVRAVVTSANLTKGGFCSNREIVAVEDKIVRAVSTPSVARSLLNATQALMKDVKLPVGETTILNAVIKRLSLVTPKAADPSIHHTLCDKHNLFETVKPKTAKFSRLVIVSPPFAADGDNTAAKPLLQRLKKDGRVDIYTGEELSVPRFSTEILNSVEAAGHKYSIFGVPKDVKDEDMRDISRPLHAKVFAFVNDRGPARVFIGSANCTGPGLDGRNRELVVEVGMSRKNLDGLLDHLKAKDLTDTVEAPNGIPMPSSIVTQPPALTAIFKPDDVPDNLGTNPNWRGILTLEWDKQFKPDSLQYAGKAIDVANVINNFTVIERDQLLKAVFLINGIEIEANCIIEIDAPDGFWNEPEDGERPDTDPEWVMFSKIFCQVAKSPKPKGVTLEETEKPKSPESNSRPIAFSIPLEQRLILITRHREQIRKRWQGVKNKELNELLHSFLVDDEVIIAQHILGVTSHSKDSLLLELAAAGRKVK